MPEIDDRILLALERNQHRGGLTGPEIRKVLGLRVVDQNKMHLALGRLVRNNQVKRLNYPFPTKKHVRLYSLVVEAEQVEFQDLPLHYVAAKVNTKPTDKKLNVAVNHPLFHESKLPEILKDALNGWINVLHLNEFPSSPGLYAFYGERGKVCLYVGQTMNIRSRGLSHGVWKQALQEFENPCAAYKIIECEDLAKTRSELVFQECLLIGLLRPKLNVVTPHHYYRD